MSSSAIGLQKKSAGELKYFRIRADSDDPNHYVKGTSPLNRADIKAVTLRNSKIWRDRKIQEQATLLQAINDPAAILLSSQTWRGPAEAWWIGDNTSSRRGGFAIAM